MGRGKEIAVGSVARRIDEPPLRHSSVSLSVIQSIFPTREGCSLRSTCGELDGIKLRHEVYDGFKFGCSGV